MEDAYQKGRAVDGRALISCVAKYSSKETFQRAREHILSRRAETEKQYRAVHKKPLSILCINAALLEHKEDQSQSWDVLFIFCEPGLHIYCEFDHRTVGGQHIIETAMLITHSYATPHLRTSPSLAQALVMSGLAAARAVFQHDIQHWERLECMPPFRPLKLLQDGRGAQRSLQALRKNMRRYVAVFNEAYTCDWAGTPSAQGSFNWETSPTVGMTTTGNCSSSSSDGNNIRGDRHLHCPKNWPLLITPRTLFEVYPTHATH